MNNIKKSKIPLFFVWLYETFVIGVGFFTKRKKLTTAHDFKEPFFIIGCGRSGNTLLRSMLVAGEEVSIPPESYVWPRIIRRFWPNSFIHWEILSSMVVAEFEAYKEFSTWEVNFHKAHMKARDLPKKNRTLSNIMNIVYTTYMEEKGEKAIRWGDKTPINTIYIDKILKIFPKAQYVHILRDPLDVVCSYVQAGLYDSYDHAARFWKEATDRAKWLSRKLSADQYIEVKYEDLVSDPRKELGKVCNFLGIRYSDDMLDYWKKTGTLGDVKYREHHKNIGKPVSKSSIGKGKKTLSPEEIARVKKIIYSG